MATIIRSIRAPQESARAFVYRVLAMYIRELLLHPGEKLIETDVAQSLEISRTPVHDTFTRLERERMLRRVPRGAIVTTLHADAIKQAVWMQRTMTVAVLGELYNNRPAGIEALEKCLANEHAALKSGSAVTMARLQRTFYFNMYALADRTPAFQALCSVSTDLYRLQRLAEGLSFWSYVVDMHAAIVYALAHRDYEGSVAALNSEYDLYEPLLEECRFRFPHYFTEN